LVPLVGTRRATLISLLSLSLTLLVLSISIQFEVRADEQVIFEDDFESYSVGTFPSDGGWHLWYSGMGSEYQVIVDDFSVSPINSLQLLGQSGWAAYSGKLIDTDSPIIGFSVSVRIESLGGAAAGPHSDVARVGFAAHPAGSLIKSYNPILFLDFGTIRLGNQDLQSYVADRWYKVTQIIDRNAETSSIWIDDVLVGENLTSWTNNGPLQAGETTWDIESFAISQNYFSTRAYFDDVTVFSVYEIDPKLELVPQIGIAATTLVGSGFAPTSEIFVTWDGIMIPTVPSPLLTDNYGNFTGIISILNQTTPGIYTVKAVDEMGIQANATFTVYSNTSPTSPNTPIEQLVEQQTQYENIPEFPSWIILPLFLVFTLFGIIIRKKIRVL
jgi:hypothetical protein